MKNLILLTFAVILLAPPGVRAQTPSADQWVRETMKQMTLDEKIGQMIFDTAEGAFRNTRSEYFQRLRERIQKLHLGGYIIYRGTPHDTAALLNELQRSAKIPLLIAGDLERGAASQFPNTAVSLPSNLGLAATADPQSAAFAGMITAREGRAVGYHWTYAPVADVNNNADNPIINIRSFGEDVGLVSRMVEAYVRAAEQAGLLTTAKHFPGHGDTATDSHIDLGVVTGDRARLDSVELAPFRAAIKAGASSIMTAHLAVPSMEPDSKLPATMSRNILTGLLREQLGFKGLIVTDALVMGGVTTQYWPGEVTLRAVEAGVDCLLMPPDAELSFRVLREAVATGRISEARINQSVKKILRAKARLGLHRNRFVDLSKVGTVFGDPAYQAHAEGIANRSITLVRDERKTLPISKTRPQKLLVVVVNADPGAAGDYFVGQVQERVENAEVVRVGPELTEVQAGEILGRAEKADVIVAPLYVRISAWKGTVGMPAAQVELLRKLAALNKPLVAISFSNPYLLRAIPEVPAYLCAYSIADVSERAAARALFGEIPITGKLPITIPAPGGQGAPLAAFGSGIQLPRLDMTLKHADAGQEERFKKAFEVIAQAIRDRVFPGAVLAVGHRGELAALKAFGAFDYSPNSPPVPVNAIWDLASVTKVMGTATAAALLVERKMLLLDVPVVRYIPEFASKNPPPPAASPAPAAERDRITVRQLLTHSSGAVGYERLFFDNKDKKAIMQNIYTMPLVNPPGSKVVYSDFGIILVGEIIERIAGQPLDRLLRLNVFDPLGMKETFYNPPKRLLARIPPTEQDDAFRKRVVRGEVHDEHAWVMGGVAGHAGLFSTAEDLAVFAQMMLNGGVYSHKRILKRSTIEAFTRRQNDVPGSSRAVGWDTPSKTSSSGHYFSAASYGHTGFTGTSLWIDPEKELFVVLLTNRIHPTRQNEGIEKVRPAVHDAVVEALKAGRP